MDTKKIAKSITIFLSTCTFLAAFYFLADIMVFRILESMFPTTMIEVMLLIVGGNIALIVIINVVLTLVGVIIRKCKKSER